MENASKALIIAGAILLSILIIAIGIYIFNGANSTIVDSMSSMSTQEKEAFNNQFLSYEGKQTGSNVKSLIGKLIANYNTYNNESSKIPNLGCSQTVYNKYQSETHSTKTPIREDLTNYVERLGNMRKVIDNKHEYTIEFKLGTNGLIDEIHIKYNDTEGSSVYK